MAILRFEQISTGVIRDIPCHLVKITRPGDTYFFVESTDNGDRLSGGYDTPSDALHDAMYCAPFDWLASDTVYHGWIF